MLQMKISERRCATFDESNSISTVAGFDGALGV
jgi:hypothetical protein